MQTLGKIFWSTILVGGTLLVAQFTVEAAKGLIIKTKESVKELKEKGI